jgi:hypothetical protein
VENHSSTALKAELLGGLPKFYDELAAHCQSRLPTAYPPKPVESWIDFEAIAPKSARRKSRDTHVQDAQLLPKVIQYEPVTAQPMNSQEQREVACTPNASVEVVFGGRGVGPMLRLLSARTWRISRPSPWFFVRTTLRLKRCVSAWRYALTSGQESVGLGRRRR